MVNELKKSTLLFEKSKEYIPGGVNSPVRAFKSVGGTPIFIKSAKGAFLYDEDGNKYIDLIGSWGPMIFGHAFEKIEEAVREAISSSFSFGTPTAKEAEMAELIVDMVPSVEMVRLVNSGTEATMSAVRLARGYTQKSKIIKFEGCYHGHGDSFLIGAGSGALTFGVPDSAGITPHIAEDTLTVPFNDLATVELVVQANQGQIAAIIIEPVVGNMGCVLPEKGFLEGLRKICDRDGILLIFDEVMTGFRLAAGGAQELFGVLPDLTTLGKIIGGGLPVGAYGGKKEIMRFLAPEGPVYQAGTLSGNPIAVSAGLAQLKVLYSMPELYGTLEKTTHKIAEGFRKNIADAGLHFNVNQIGSMFSLFFTEQEVKDFGSAKTSDTTLFARYFHAMLKQGVYLAPSQFESLFVSAAIDESLADRIIEANRNALRDIFINVE